MPVDEVNTTISFRLPAELHDELARIADASGTTKHQLARTLIVRALDAGQPHGDLSAESDLDETFRTLIGSLGELRLALGSWCPVQSFRRSRPIVIAKKFADGCSIASSLPLLKPNEKVTVAGEPIQSWSRLGRLPSPLRSGRRRASWTMDGQGSSRARACGRGHSDRIPKPSRRSVSRWLSCHRRPRLHSQGLRPHARLGSYALTSESPSASSKHYFQMLG